MAFSQVVLLKDAPKLQKQNTGLECLLFFFLSCLKTSSKQSTC